MKAHYIVSALALLTALLGGCATTTAPSAADLGLSVPETPADRKYLGLDEATGEFHVEAIQCEVLVIDCFDMYCHICQSGAKHVNELYRLVQEQNLGTRVKFLGLGLGDSPLEVALYKEKFDVPFPVFPDRKSVVAKQFGPVRLPNLIVLRREGGTLKVVNTSPGPLLNPSQVLSHIRNNLVQKQSYRWQDPIQTVQPTCEPNSRSCRATQNTTAPGSTGREGTLER